MKQMIKQNKEKEKNKEKEERPRGAVPARPKNQPTAQVLTIPKRYAGPSSRH
jgi:hypothetical protein